jgi:hypothetical protein
MAGAMLMISCNEPSSSVVLLKKLLLKDFPSGSSLEFYNNRIYLIGDDAKQILVLDQAYNHIDSIPLFEARESRIPKYKKADLEASALIVTGDEARVLVFGSAAVSNREVVLELSPGKPSDSIKTISTAVFTNRLKQAGIKEINLEGAATVNEYLVLCNRANENNTVNNFIITTPDFLDNQATIKFNISSVKLPKQKNINGISGLAYVPEKDLLLFTASTELTGNAYDDGEIGDSYIGWIKDASTKLYLPEISPDGIINLAEADKEFAAEKIESICVEKYHEDIFDIHLVSDNDKGESTLFKIQFQLK